MVPLKLNLDCCFSNFRSLFESLLALLDYVSRAHEIEIRPSVVRPSVCGIDYL